jgi:hypothetical protein
MRIFVPIEDASIDQEAGSLVPYRYGLTCARGLRDALVLRDGVWSEREPLSDGSSSHRLNSVPACPPDRR